jgi:hypothetical protein
MSFIPIEFRLAPRGLSGLTSRLDRSGFTPILATRRRALQITLGVIWLLDAALQYQPYMFSKGFVSEVIQGTAAGNPAVIAEPITWSAGLMMHHIAVYNALFATIQLFLALGLLWRRTVKAALAASIAWAVAVWWLGEGLGGVLAGTASPFTGAPGAVILYVLLALLAWPSPAADTRGSSVATTGRLGPVTPRLLWAVLWGSLAYFAFQPASSSPGALGTILTGMKDSEPGWISSIDGALAHVVAHLGTQVSVTIAVLCALAGATVALGRFTRLGVLIAAIVGAVIWLAEDFGAIFTGQGTDPNSGLLLIVAAAAFWPFADVPPREADHARLTSATRARTRWASPAARAHRSATKRLVASPVQTGGTRREIPGSDGVPGAER